MGKPRLLKHDGFARYELYKALTGKGSCSNCGRTKTLYHFYTENDDSLRRSKNHIKGHFCCVECMRDYNS